MEKEKKSSILERIAKVEMAVSEIIKRMEKLEQSLEKVDNNIRMSMSKMENDIKSKIDVMENEIRKLKEEFLLYKVILIILSLLIFGKEIFPFIEKLIRW
ncbi:MAG: hypothetical protein RMJ67_01095 [Elusimicrobiota bacterium]|nr:hypothetical protein [Endomicrobiia bacterium]MDW8165099.1 hypothetical protein [Elusimicrobiota bacterium]